MTVPTEAMTDQEALAAGAALAHHEWPRYSDEDELPPQLRPLAVATADAPELQRIGPSYRTIAGALTIVFREVRTDRELSAHISIAYGSRHLFSTGTTLNVPTRDRLSKAAADLASVTDRAA